ncbi:MAG: hypothetical protein ACFFBV_09200 [Promethearchaeota archaeon]
MRKKKIILILSLLMLIDIFSAINFANAYYCNLNFLNINKNLLYFDEDIKINASWELNYNINNEIAYVQIQIFDNLENIIWNSSEYNQIGFYEKNWTLEIDQLNIDFSNSSTILYIKFFSFYFQIDTTNTVSTFLETVKITLIKRKLFCSLEGYREHIEFGESLNLKVKFFDELSQDTLNLINLTIKFMISFNNLIIHQCNYTTNNSGVISVLISSFTHLKIGQNILIFSLVNNKIFNMSIFIYELFVEKNPIFVDILSFNEELKENEELEIKLSYYYSFNQTLYPLAGYDFTLKIYDNKTLVFISEFKTDNSGKLEIRLAQTLFNSNQQSEELSINIIFNGTYSLPNKTLVLCLRVNQGAIPKMENSFQLNFISFISILIIVLIVLSIIINNTKSKSKKLLAELVMRY